MRDFFIRSLEKLVGLIVILSIIGVVIGSVSAMFVPDGGFLAGLAVLVGGTIYIILLGGGLYLGLGIYDNTRRTAEALMNRNAADLANQTSSSQD
ncbi:hypothetical protein [Qingshengfaniella alkalisoli]|uniref:Superfamily III holin-X n=1 Tax=Qingshengfaniella alkalisoli TaxID=2599296 RepID=A0A5B8IAQ7_9RHOB|nr:hypothetical protein [Qingshengfaniella alkalisoli]QDY70426.1 hypothetical protein FPZ52_11970 [Qingshengfaniella alkalisoli]